MAGVQTRVALQDIKTFRAEFGARQRPPEAEHSGAWKNVKAFNRILQLLVALFKARVLKMGSGNREADPGDWILNILLVVEITMSRCDSSVSILLFGI